MFSYIGLPFALWSLIAFWLRRSAIWWGTVMIKIKVSYERPEELKRILDRLRPEVKSLKVARNQEGQFKKAYIEVKE